jgi:Ser/Thr protein kinase RdoA (MazF antagonist)
VKLWGTDSPAGEREVLFYRTFGRDSLGVSIPACHHAAIDPIQQRGVLVLEDFHRAVQGDALQPLDRRQALALAADFARMHARRRDSPMLYRAAWLRCLPGQDRDAAWVSNRRALFLQRFGDRLDDLTRTLLYRMEPALAIARQRLDRAPSTLLHADLHLDNILFDRDRAIVLDWARCARGPAVLDLADLLFGMCRSDDVDEVLDAYAAAGESDAGEALDFAAMKDFLGGALLWRFSTSTCGIARWLPEASRGDALIAAGIQRAIDAVHLWLRRDPALFSFL